MRIHFIRSPKRRNAVLEELYGLLTRRGIEVTEGIPDRAALDLDVAPQHDLYVLKARTELAVSFAGVLHERGAKVLNPPAACALVLNKIVTTAMMRDAGIPAPRSWAVTDRAMLSSIASTTAAPLIIKPFNGIHSRNVALVRDLAELETVPVTNSPLLVQEFVEGCTERLKVHCVGDQVFATWKPFSLGGDSAPGRPCEVSAAVRRIALRCGALFGMGLYGLDVLLPRDGPVVVDVNSFPGYAGVPGIATVLADYIDGYARGRHSLPSDGATVGRNPDAGA
jgi:glutathione synthase/RimK-type ligase-like ATP-grasp enzyme